MDTPHLERLSAADCRRLLPDAPVGRLAVPTPNFPTLDPVPFAVVEGELVVAVRAGSAGDAMSPGTVVAFEADVLDRKGRQGWSVICKGPVEELDPDVADVVRPMLAPWPAAPTDRLLLIRSDRISGQRIVSGAQSIDAPPAPPSNRAPAVSRRSLLSDEAVAHLRKGDQPVG